MSLIKLIREMPKEWCQGVNTNVKYRAGNQKITHEDYEPLWINDSAEYDRHMRKYWNEL